MQSTADQTARVPRRVREQAREVVVLMAFSAISSVVLAALLTVLARLGHQG